MAKISACCRSYRDLCLFLFALISVRDASAQLAGTYHSAPGTMASYEYHSGVYHTITIPVDVSFHFSNDTPTSQLGAIIHKPIIDVLPNGQAAFPSYLQYPMAVTGTSYNGRDFHGDLLGTQYLFDWRIEPAANGELLWNGNVGWAGGRFELTTITNAPLVPGLAGDYNQDGAVDAADYVVWRKGLGTTYLQIHYNDWRAHIGETLDNGIGANASSVVPEPTTFILLLIGILAICSCRHTIASHSRALHAVRPSFLKCEQFRHV
jgi:hypothetical protein